MGLERRKGNLYYYRKRREGERVVSEYVGSSEIAYIADHTAKRAQIKKDASHEQLLRTQRSMAEVDSMLEQFSTIVDAVTDAHLIALGYHKHKRQWRRRRE